MKHVIFTTCEFASNHVGILSICGVRDVFYAKQAPARLTKFFIVVRMVFDSSERGLHTFRLSMSDEAGKPVIPTISDSIDLRGKPDTRFFGDTKLFELNGIVIPKFGYYQIDFVVDDIPLLTHLVALAPEP